MMKNRAELVTEFVKYYDKVTQSEDEELKEFVLKIVDDETVYKLKDILVKYNGDPGNLSRFACEKRMELITQQIRYNMYDFIAKAKSKFKDDFMDSDMTNFRMN